MRNLAIPGALLGAMLGVLIAREFTDHIAICLPAGMVGSCAGILLSFLFVRRKPE